MVIYLNKIRELILRISIYTCVIVFIYCASYFISYIKYDNKEYVLDNALKVENELLKKEIENLRNVSVSDGKIAKVIVRDIYGFYDEIIIDLGSDVVRVKDLVINEDGLVGVVYKVSKNKSYVKLLTSNYKISVKLGDTYGIYNNGSITMLDKYSDIKVGEKVYTSGLDESLGDIYIGEVLNVYYDQEGLGKNVDVKYVNNDNLNYVVVLGRR